jgi:hypothetical protein
MDGREFHAKGLAMKTWKSLGIVAASLLTPTFVEAQHGHRHGPPPCQPLPACPPGYMIVPPAQPPVAAQPGQPVTPPSQQATPPALSEDERGRLAAAFSERDVGGVSTGYRSGAPNVVGNQLANNCLRLSFAPRSGGEGGGGSSFFTSFVILSDGVSGINTPRTGPQGNVLDPLSFNVSQASISNLGVINVNSVLHSLNALATDNANFQNGSPIPMAAPTGSFVDQYLSFMESNFGPGGTLQFQSGSIIFTGDTSSPRDIGPSDTFLLQGDYNYFIAAVLNELCITTPGTLLGRYKVSENNSPIPRDRMFFSYNMYSGTPLGRDVHRFTPGIEKTFFGGMSSIELRMPFGSTLNGDLITDNILANGTKTRLGDLQLATKTILAQSDAWLLSIGVGLTVPTADDIHAHFADGTPVARIKNEAYHLQPFLGFLYAPTPDFFFQGFTQIDMDLTGDPVILNLGLPFGTNMQQIGRLRDRTLLSNDLAIGYWLFRDGCGLVSGIAPQLEVHYDQTLDHYRTLEAAGTRLEGGGTYSSVALTGAVNIELRQDSMFTIAASVPLTNENNRGFEWELLLQFNYRFGASVAGNTPGLAGGR